MKLAGPVLAVLCIAAIGVWWRPGSRVPPFDRFLWWLLIAAMGGCSAGIVGMVAQAR